MNEPKQLPANNYRLRLLEMCIEAGLTADQRNVYLLTCAGLTDAEIAEEAFIKSVHLVQEKRAAASNKLREKFFPKEREISPAALLRCVRNRPEVDREPAIIEPSEADYRSRPKPFGAVAGDLRTAQDSPLSVALGLACKITGALRPRLTKRLVESAPKRTADEMHATEIERLRRLGAELAER